MGKGGHRPFHVTTSTSGCKSFSFRPHSSRNTAPVWSQVPGQTGLMRDQRRGPCRAAGSENRGTNARRSAPRLVLTLQRREHGHRLRLRAYTGDLPFPAPSLGDAVTPTFRERAWRPGKVAWAGGT
uniref:Uncharacterized protein n=1 Tax=Pipistrellus kuhlii TaxID=59472 RepID=A0A7J7XAV8_PIPKU|nr:hypothetical protein mPipKuh1_010579 [Pipistrellus kuhlii]